MLTEAEAALEVLRRREARKSILEYARYLKYEAEPAKHHVLLLDKYLQRVVDGELKRLMVFMPPGCAKSTYCTVIMPSFYLGKFPDRRVITASYDSDLATDFAGKVKTLFSENIRYKALFPGMELSADTKAKGHWNVKDRKGGLYATGVGSAVTGRRGNLAVLDDLVKGREDADSARIMIKTWNWFTSDLSTRMLPDNAIVYITTRWSQNDPAGQLLPEDWNGESGPIKCSDGRVWEVLSLPAEALENDPLGRKPGEWLWSEYYTARFWEQTKKLQLLKDTRNWTSLYQQNPTPEEGTYFKREDFKWYTAETQPKRYVPYIAGDFAVSEGRGDFTEIGVFGINENDDIYIAPDNGWWGGQETSEVWIDRLLDFVKYYKPQMFISEKGVIRNAVEPFLDKRMAERAKDKSSIYVSKEWLSHIGDKTANARAFQARTRLGKVYLPDNETGKRILQQLIEFPAGKYDDIVDVCGLMARYLNETVVPTEIFEEVKVMDKWDRAFERMDIQSDNTWRTV